MPQKYLIKIVFLLVLMPGFKSWSQSSNIAIDFIENTINTVNSGIITAQSRIKNNSTVAVEGIFEAHSSHVDLYLVQRKPRSIIIKANVSIFIPIKAVVSTTALAGNKTTIEAVFTPQGGN